MKRDKRFYNELHTLYKLETGYEAMIHESGFCDQKGTSVHVLTETDRPSKGYLEWLVKLAEETIERRKMEKEFKKSVRGFKGVMFRSLQTVPEGEPSKDYVNQS